MHNQGLGRRQMIFSKNRWCDFSFLLWCAIVDMEFIWRNAFFFKGNAGKLWIRAIKGAIKSLANISSSQEYQTELLRHQKAREIAWVYYVSAKTPQTWKLAKLWEQLANVANIGKTIGAMGKYGNYWQLWEQFPNKSSLFFATFACTSSSSPPIQSPEKNVICQYQYFWNFLNIFELIFFQGKNLPLYTFSCRHWVQLHF